MIMGVSLAQALPLLATASAPHSVLEFYATVQSVVQQWPELTPGEQSSALRITTHSGLSSNELRRIVGQGTRPLAARLWEQRNTQTANDDRYIRLRNALPTKAKIEREIAQEKELWSQFDQGSLLKKFKLLEKLSHVYLRNLCQGGSFALEQIDTIRSSLLAELAETKEYWKLVTTSAEGHALFYWPARRQYPRLLTFPPGRSKAPILLQRSLNPNSIGSYAYVRIDTAVLIQDVVCSNCMAQKKQAFAQGDLVPPIELIWSSSLDTITIYDGHHRLGAAAELHADYILGKFVFSHSLPGKRYSHAELTTIDHAEHMRRIDEAGNLNPVAPEIDYW
jgi:hypothetical protein